MITSANAQKIVDIFNSGKEMWSKDHVFDICAMRICGTVHCVAGWFAICYSSSLKGTYRQGVAAMERVLELVPERWNLNSNLTDWARMNPDIWGNMHGYSMFSSVTAYSSPQRPFGAENMQDVVDHWQEVVERLKAYEKLESS